MARISLGLGTSHGVMLSIPHEYWKDRVAFDRANPEHFYQGKTYTFPQLVELMQRHGRVPEFTPEISAGRQARCNRAIHQLADTFEQAKPDLAIIAGNDQMEVFTADHVPAFAIFWGDYVEGHPRSPEFLAKLNPAVARAEADRTPAVYTQYPTHPALGRHLIQRVTAEGFDVSQIRKLAAGEIGVNSAPHAYGFVYRRLMRDKVVPHVPVFVNTFYPPNQPPAARCFEFGRALARAIAAWPEQKTVALIGSGGLSHFVIDEAFDRQVLDALQSGDARAFAALPEALLQSGTSESKNWIVVAGAMAEAGLKMQLLDYVPCYRSEAGTGSAMGFAVWR
jgi:3-O-methylgallate 3,4-dioxygenase